jgi:hypothetical protein
MVWLSGKTNQGMMLKKLRFSNNGLLFPGPPPPSSLPGIPLPPLCPFNLKVGLGCFGLFIEVISKSHNVHKCHSERSEESHILKYLRPFASLRVTEKAVLKKVLVKFG